MVPSVLYKHGKMYKYGIHHYPVAYKMKRSTIHMSNVLKHYLHIYILFVYFSHSCFFSDCSNGNFDVGCLTPCNCDTQCHAITGKCLSNCVAGKMGDTCQQGEQLNFT
jgi:hypothetical protein